MAPMQGAGQVAAPVGEDTHVLAGPQNEQADVAEAAVDGPAVRQVLKVAQVVPAEGDQVRELVGVACARRLPERQVATEVAARHEDAEAREAKGSAGAVSALV